MKILYKDSFMSIAKINYDFINKLKKLKFIDAIWLYGSRARGDFKERSDIDLVIICPNASLDQWIEILKIIDKRDTLLKVDLLRYDEIKDESLKKRIKKEKVVIYEK